MALTISKKKLIEDILKELPLMPKRDIEVILEVLFNKIKTYLMKDYYHVRLPNIGTLKPKIQKARKGVNPRTQDVLMIPQKRSITFQINQAFKRELNNDAT